MSCLRCPIADPTVRCRGLDVPRFCELIDPACPQYDPGYIAVIEDQTYRRRSAPAPIPPAESADLTRRMKACLYRSAGATGCGCGRCGLRGGAAVSHRDCFQCLTQYPP